MKPLYFILYTLYFILYTLYFFILILLYTYTTLFSFVTRVHVQGKIYIFTFEEKKKLQSSHGKDISKILHLFVDRKGRVSCKFCSKILNIILRKKNVHHVQSKSSISIFHQLPHVLSQAGRKSYNQFEGMSDDKQYQKNLSRCYKIFLLFFGKFNLDC